MGLGFICGVYLGCFVGYVLGVCVWIVAGVDVVGGFSLGRVDGGEA